MAKYHLKIQAIQLRRQGVSVNRIAESLGVTKSIVSLWVRDVSLSSEQLEKLKQNSITGRLKGGLIGAFKQKQARLNRIKTEKENGVVDLAGLTKREFLIAGLAIYWSEGNKKTREVRFSNSDPQIIVFMINWFKKCFQLTERDLRCFVGINETHRHREDIVKKYWSTITTLPLESFRKTSFKKTINKKVYENFNEHYGNLDIRVLQGAKVYYKILGLIHGLYKAGTNKSPA